MSQCKNNHQSITSHYALLSLNQFKEEMVGEKINKQALEKKFLTDYVEDLVAINRTLSNTANTDEVRTLQSEMKKKIDIYEQQILNYKNQFPQDNIASYEADIYFFRATLKMSSIGWAGAVGKDMLDQPESGCLTILLSAFLSSNESSRYTREAIQLLEQASNIYNDLNYHHVKAVALNSMGQCNNAIQELEYVMVNTDDENLYFKARKLKDEISQALQAK